MKPLFKDIIIAPLKWRFTLFYVRKVERKGREKRRNISKLLLDNSHDITWRAFFSSFTREKKQFAFLNSLRTFHTYASFRVYD